MTVPNGSAKLMNVADEILGPPLARGQANDIAIMFHSERITFAELNSTVNRFGNALKPYLNKGDRALLVLKDSPSFVAAFFGVIRIGAVAVPVSTRLAARDLAFIIQDSGAEVLLIDHDLLPVYTEAATLCSRKPALVAVCGPSDSDFPKMSDLAGKASPELVTAPTYADEMAYLMYTSGTTGTPKGSVHRHGGVVVADECMRWLGMKPGERIFSASKMFFAYGMAHALMGALRFGATIVVYDGTPDASLIASIVERYSPTIVATIPTLYRNLLRDGHVKGAGFKNVRVYLSSGEGLPAAVYERWLEETGVAIFDGLGTTETIFQFMMTRPGVLRAGSCGKPAPYCELKLVDDDGNTVVTPDTRGMSWVKMDSVCMGYWNQPERTAAAFRDGWFRTGDVFSFDADGWWHHHGRGDDQLKISGQWVNPMEIEEHVVGVPGVTDAAVIGVPDDDGLVRLNLFLVSDTNNNEELAMTVKEKLLSTLSIYKCPRRISFVDALPRTATGKLQRYRLRQEATSAYLQNAFPKTSSSSITKVHAADPPVREGIRNKAKVGIMKQIKFHGLGGQGVVTAAKLFAEASVAQGTYAQSTPAYGHERRGAPVSADVFASADPIKVKCFVFELDVVVLFGAGVLGHNVDIAKNTSKDTIFIVNLPVGVTLPFPAANVYSVDALSITLEETMNDVPNAAMLGAMAAAGLVDLEAVVLTITKKFGAKGAANAAAARRAYAETRCSN